MKLGQKTRLYKVLATLMVFFLSRVDAKEINTRVGDFFDELYFGFYNADVVEYLLMKCEIYGGDFIVSELKIHLSVCKDVAEVSLMGQTFRGGHVGTINPSILINEEGALEIDLSDIGHRPRMGEGKDIVLVNVMICTGHMTVIPVYKDSEVKPLTCCACSTNGCCVYGRSGCSC